METLALLPEILASAIRLVSVEKGHDPRRNFLGRLPLVGPEFFDLGLDAQRSPGAVRPPREEDGGRWQPPLSSARPILPSSTQMARDFFSELADSWNSTTKSASVSVTRSPTKVTP